MGLIETQSSDPLDLAYKSNFQILYSVTFFWLEQQHYQQRFHGFERFPIFHQNGRYTGKISANRLITTRKKTRVDQ